MEVAVQVGVHEDPAPAVAPGVAGAVDHDPRLGPRPAMYKQLPCALIRDPGHAAKKPAEGACASGTVRVPFGRCVQLVAKRPVARVQPMPQWHAESKVTGRAN